MAEDKNGVLKKIEKPDFEKEKSGKIEVRDTSVERPPRPEQIAEKALEGAGEEKAEVEQLGEAVSTAQTAGAPVNIYGERQKSIEKILSNGLEDIYLNMAPDLQRQFKIQGERTAEKINELLERTKVKVSKIVELIKSWLKLIPGVNKFFLEQEAKIKTDEIMKLKNNRK